MEFFIPRELEPSPTGSVFSFLFRVRVTGFLLYMFALWMFWVKLDIVLLSLESFLCVFIMSYLHANRVIGSSIKAVL